MITIKTCLEIIAKVLGEPVVADADTTDTKDEDQVNIEEPCPVRHPSKLLAVHQTRVEVLYMKQRLMFDVTKDYPEALDICEQMIEH